MAQPIYIPEILGAVEIKKGVTYTTDSIRALNPLYATANAFELKVKAENAKEKRLPVIIHINDSVGVPFYHGDLTRLSSTNYKYIFEADCIVAILKYLDVTV